MALLLGAAVLPIGCGLSQRRKDQALVDAIKTGSPERLHQALLSGANPRQRFGPKRETPLLLAIASEDGRKAEIPAFRSIVEDLIASGADPSVQNDEGWDALGMAASARDAVLCDRFCRMGLSPVEIEGKGVSPLHVAALNDDVASLESMIPWLKNRQIDTATASGLRDTPLYLASFNGLEGAATCLLRAGADPNLVNSAGFTPLMAACLQGKPRIASLLLEHGAEVDRPYRNGATALSFACLDGRLDVAQLLLAHGADPNHQNKGGVTPMMDAAMKGHLEVIEVLKKAGANPALKSGKGRTAADYEREWRASRSSSTGESIGR
ncbi:MAG TPA: ankyrin repeat domain-containing protein [Holophagaceae bacterium]|nr:ankyrin repeat domain-containing protein [Holophagaceae bacterium]